MNKVKLCSSLTIVVLFLCISCQKEETMEDLSLFECEIIVPSTDSNSSTTTNGTEQTTNVKYLVEDKQIINKFK